MNKQPIRDYLDQWKVYIEKYAEECEKENRIRPSGSARMNRFKASILKFVDWQMEELERCN